MNRDIFTHGVLHDIFLELQDYLQREKRFALLSIAEKVTIIVSALVVLIVMALLATQVVLCLMLGLAGYIGDALGSTPAGYFVVAVLDLLLLAVFYILRTKLVVNPLARFMAHLFDTSQQ